MQKEMKRKNISILREKRGFWRGRRAREGIEEFRTSGPTATARKRSFLVKKRIFGAQKNDN